MDDSFRFRACQVVEVIVILKRVVDTGSEISEIAEILPAERKYPPHVKRLIIKAFGQFADKFSVIRLSPLRKKLFKLVKEDIQGCLRAEHAADLLEKITEGSLGKLGNSAWIRDESAFNDEGRVFVVRTKIE